MDRRAGLAYGPDVELLNPRLTQHLRSYFYAGQAAPSRKNVEQVAAFDVKDDVLVHDGALRPELRVLRVVPVEVLHH